MRRATQKDHDLCVGILAQSFRANPGVNSVVKNDTKKELRVHRLCSYAFKTSLEKQGAYISDNEKGVALCYQESGLKHTFAQYWRQFILVWQVIGFRRLGTVLRRESLINQRKPKDHKYLYFWFLGVDPGFQDGRAFRELKTSLIAQADQLGLPLYLETTLDRNMRVYKQFGFEIYDSCSVDGPGTIIYFMRRFPPGFSS